MATLIHELGQQSRRTDIRNQLFAKIAGQSMDFFNRMRRPAVLMSPHTNDTTAMQAV